MSDEATTTTTSKASSSEANANVVVMVDPNVPAPIKDVGKVEPVADSTPAERVSASIKAALVKAAAGKAAAGATTDKVAAKPGDSAAQGGTAVEPKGSTAQVTGELSEEQIKAAADKAATKAAIKAAVVEPAPGLADKLKQAQEAYDKGDPLKAMELLGFKVDAAVAQALGLPKADDKPAAEHPDLVKLKEENAKLQQQLADAAAETAKAKAAQEYQETVKSVIADKDFPGLDEAKVKEAFGAARQSRDELVKDLGRPLNATEGDKLVRFFLKQASDKATAAATTAVDQKTKIATPKIARASGVVVPAKKQARGLEGVQASIRERAKQLRAKS